ncbi:MAG: hypothetical protein COC01_00275 [Bacteroidetes bacterium]|nr:MAG: hypothetical protein COC01_00275 [Bacteroidota bacterium]
MFKPKLPSFIKIPKNKSFEFTPRYYDQKKEQYEEKVERIKRELETGRKEIKFKPSAQRPFSQYNYTIIRFIIILALLLIVFNWLLQ